MRVAVCISGQARCFKESWPYIKANLIDINGQPDIFLHTWASPGDHHSASGKIFTISSDLQQYITDNIKPKKYIIEDVKTFSNPTLNIDNIWASYGDAHRSALVQTHGNPEAAKHVLQSNFYSMFYSIFKAHNLCKLYALEQGIHYDCIVRIRFDFAPMQPIHFDRFDMNRLHFLNIHQPDGLISDWINFGRSEIMDVYASIYMLYEIIREKQGGHQYFNCNESLIRDILQRFEIRSQSFDLQYKLCSH